MPTNTYQQGVDAYAGCTDTYPREYYSSSNYGNANELMAAWYVDAGDRSTVVIRFDISDISPDVTITSATLQFARKQLVGSGTISIHRCLRDWVELEVTWIIYSTGNNWESPGGLGAADHDSDAEDTQAPDSPTVFTITDMVQKWVDGTWANQGALIKRASEVDWFVKVHSSEAASSSDRPLLTVVYEEDGEEEEIKLFGIIGCGVLPFKRAV